MTDYKELCENPQAGWGYVDELRDAIKQLVKERDAAIADMTKLIKESGTCICDLCEFFDEKECEKPVGCSWKWRGCVDGDNC